MLEMHKENISGKKEYGVVKTVILHVVSLPAEQWLLWLDVLGQAWAQCAAALISACGG